MCSRVWLCALATLLGCGSQGPAPNSTGAAAGAAGTGLGGAGLGGAGASGSAAGTSGGGSAGAGGASAGTAGASGSTAGMSGGGSAGASATCKRGIAANVAPGAAFAPGVSFWYNWSLDRAPAATGIEFVPMVWGQGSLGGAVPAGARYLLGFNEPNFKAQANLSAQQAASLWPSLEGAAGGAGLSLVSPAVNFCGPASSCNGTDPYAYLRAFFDACSGCRVDYVAVHWYNCDLASLRDYLEPGGGLEGFEQFNRPIWLTEFACAIGADTSVAAQEAYMREAIPYLENNPRVFRYAWFSADPIPNAKLLNPDGSPTPLGIIYRDLPSSCQ